MTHTLTLNHPTNRSVNCKFKMLNGQPAFGFGLISSAVPLPSDVQDQLDLNETFYTTLTQNFPNTDYVQRAQNLWTKGLCVLNLFWTEMSEKYSVQTGVVSTIESPTGPLLCKPVFTRDAHSTFQNRMIVHYWKNSEQDSTIEKMPPYQKLDFTPLTHNVLQTLSLTQFSTFSAHQRLELLHKRGEIWTKLSNAHIYHRAKTLPCVKGHAWGSTYASLRHHSPDGSTVSIRQEIHKKETTHQIFINATGVDGEAIIHMTPTEMILKRNASKKNKMQSPQDVQKVIRTLVEAIIDCDPTPFTLSEIERENFNVPDLQVIQGLNVPQRHLPFVLKLLGPLYTIAVTKAIACQENIRLKAQDKETEKKQLPSYLPGHILANSLRERVGRITLYTDKNGEEQKNIVGFTKFRNKELTPNNLVKLKPQFTLKAFEHLQDSLFVDKNIYKGQLALEHMAAVEGRAQGLTINPLHNSTLTPVPLPQDSGLTAYTITHPNTQWKGIVLRAHTSQVHPETSTDVIILQTPSFKIMNILLPVYGVRKRGTLIVYVSKRQKDLDLLDAFLKSAETTSLPSTCLSFFQSQPGHSLARELREKTHFLKVTNTHAVKFIND
jgi:hypothetical protein